jgi:hypothetical protein
MMNLRFRVEAMCGELNALAAATSNGPAGGFLEKGSTERLKSLAERLRRQFEAAVKNGNSKFRWETLADENIITAWSKFHKGKDTEHKPLQAEISVRWDCQPIDATEAAVIEGVTVVDLYYDSTKRKTFHVDVCNGGNVDGSGHPPFHMQFTGPVSDVPRFPSFILSPVDVIDFTILEIFQRQWRMHMEQAKTKTVLRKLPQQQRIRTAKVLARWSELLQLSDHENLVAAIQRPYNIPFVIC